MSDEATASAATFSQMKQTQKTLSIHSYNKAPSPQKCAVAKRRPHFGMLRRFAFEFTSNGTFRRCYHSNTDSLICVHCKLASFFPTCFYRWCLHRPWGFRLAASPCARKFNIGSKNRIGLLSTFVHRTNDSTFFSPFFDSHFIHRKVNNLLRASVQATVFFCFLFRWIMTTAKSSDD